MTIAAIREYAKTEIKGNRLILMVGFILPFVLWTVIIQLYNSLFGFENIFSPVSIIFSGWTGFQWEYILLPVLLIILFIVGDVFSVSYRWLGLDFLGDKELEINDIFQALKKDNIRAVITLVITRGIIVLLWSLLFILPGIWKAYLYSQAGNNLKMDPNISPIEALKQSEEQMKGYIKEYFLLQLSFSPWYLVPIGLFISFLVSNWNEILIAFDVGLAAVDLALGIVVTMLLILGFILLVFSLYVEPYKLISKQIFYKEIQDLDENR